MLGYALTHPRRLRAALDARPDRTRFEEATEAVVGLMRTGPGDLAQGWLARQRSDLDGMHDRLVAASSAFGPVTRFFGDLGDLGALPLRLAQLAEATDPASLKRAIGDMLDAVLGALIPGGADPGPALAERVLSVFDLMEAPFKAGARDPEALRGFRAAASCRRLLRPAFDVLNRPGPGLDLRGELRAALDRAFDGMEAQLLRTIAGQLRRVVEQVGPLLEAVGRLSVKVEVRADGPQPAPGADPKWQDDGLPVPHAALGHPLTITEIIVALVQLGFGFWEMFRTRDWQGRPANVFLHVVGMAWHSVRSLLRIFAPGTVNGLDSDFARWLFKDQGDFWVQTVLRVLQSLYEFAQAPNNGFLGLGAALLKQHAFMGLPRLAYQFARATWYFDQRRRDNAGTGGVSPARFMMGLWGPTSFIALLWGMAFMPWDGFALEKLTKQPGTMVLLVIGLLIAVAAGYLTLGPIANENPFKFRFDPEPGTIATAAGAAGIGILAALLIMGSIESPTKVGVIVTLAILLAGVAGLGIALAATIANNADSAHTLVDVLTMFLGLLGPGLITMVMGWFIVDDGRDKPGYFDKLKADNSPYHLPFRQGEGWLVGQGVHGIFSHYDGADGGISSNSNHWSYDFNNRENSVALAARTGIVVEASTPNPNGTSDQNTMQFMHVGWNGDVDPGKPDEGVLTWHIYVHLSQHRHYATLGQRTEHGVHVADIDDTGRSAQHHLHIGVFDMQSGRERGIPFVFADPSTKQRRGFGHHDGKPVSFGMYDSAHVEVQPPRGALLLTTDVAPVPGIVGATSHSHLLRIDADALPATLPASLTLTTEPGGPIGSTHTHDLTLTAEQLGLLLKGKLPEGGLKTTTTALHDHSIVMPNGGARSGMVRLVAPPGARLVGRRPAPYRLLGERLTLRVNGQATAFWMFGAHRPSLAADVVLDGGAPAGAGLSLLNPLPPPGTTLHSVALASDAQRGSTRALAAELTQRLRAAGAADAFVGAEPVLVLESRRRGGAVNLTVDGNAAEALAGAAPPTATGAGALADNGKITRDQFATHIQDILANGWGAPLGGISTTAGSPMALAVGLAAAALDASSSRLKAVLELLYDTSTKTLRADSPLPLAEGRIGIAPLAFVPLLVRPARAVLDLAHASMQAATIATTPLVITLGTAALQNVRLEAGMDAAAIAARIMRDCEGVRAVPDGATRVALETIACGSAVTIRLSKNGADPSAAPPVGGACALPGPAVADTAALSQAALIALLTDAKTRATTDTVVAAVNPRASIAAGKLVLEVNAGKSIQVAAWNLPGLPNPNFTPADAADPHRLVSNSALPDPIALTDTGWLDLTIEGRLVRIPFDGAPARVEFPPARRLPEARQTMRIRTTDAPDVTLSFDTAPGSLFDVAARITAGAPGVVARLAWRLSVERATWAAPSPAMLALGQPSPAPGLAALGFLRTPAELQAGGAGPGSDPVALGPLLPPADEIVHGPLLRQDTPPGQPPPARTALTSPDAPPAAGNALAFTAEAGSTIAAVATPPVGPLAMTVDAAGTTASTATLPDPFPLRGFHQRVKISASAPLGAGPTATRATTATTWLALDAAPAALLARGTPNLPAAAGSLLGLSVTRGSATAQTGSLVLDGIADSAAAAAAINAAHPGLRAVVRPDQRLAIETRRGGTGMALSLSGRAALRALGFAMTPTEAAAGVISAQGGGNVADDERVTRPELAAAVKNALDAVTVPGAVLGATPWPFTVVDDGTRLLLRAPGGTVALGSDPDSPGTATVPSQRDTLAQRLAPTPTAPLGTRLAALDATGVVALDDGVLTVGTPAGLGAVVPIHGEAAALLATDPLPGAGTPDLAAQAAALRAAAITVTTDAGSAVVGPMPATVAETPDAITTFLAEAAPLARILLDRTGRLLVASRTFGSASSVTLDLSAISALPAPLGALTPRLGFLADAATGFVLGDSRAASLDPLPTLAKVDRAAMARLLALAQATGAAPQAVIHADAPTGTLRLTAGAPNWRIAVLGPGHPDITGLVPVPASLGAVLEAPFAGTRRLHAGVLLLFVTQGVLGQTRLVSVPLLGRGARIELEPPAAPAALTGASLSFALDDLGFANVSVPMPAAPNAAALCRHLERGSEGRLLAEVLPSGNIAISTARRGHAARLIAIPGGALTNNIATGFRLVGSAAARGAGTLPDLAAATAQDVATAINAGWLADGAGAALDEPAPGTVAQPLLPYDFTEGNFVATLDSPRRGAEGSLRRLAPAATPAWLDETLADGPAVRAALVTKPLPEAGTRISGTMALVLNDNGTAVGLPGREAVSVSFADATWTAPQVAAAINKALQPRGLGVAQARVDGRVVIEVAATGVAGSIAATPPASPAAPDPFAVLIDPNFAADRGWPGAGRTLPGTPVPVGWRAAHGDAAQADATWAFTLDGPPPAPLLSFPVTKGSAQAAIADALDTALASVVVGGLAQRIGVARLDPAGHLLIEMLDHAVTLGFGGAAPADPGDNPGAQWEAAPEPALGLVPTDRPRTLRLARDPDGKGEIARADDWGWVRLPTAPNGFAVVNGVSVLNAKAFGHDGTADHEIAQLPLLPPGRWYMAVRAEAARDSDGTYRALSAQGRGLAALRTWPGFEHWGALQRWNPLPGQPNRSDRNTFPFPGSTVFMLRAVSLPDGTAAAEFPMPMP